MNFHFKQGDKMKKLFLIAAVLCGTPGAFAGIPEPAQTDVKLTAELGAYVVNDHIPNNMMDSVLEPKLGLRADINDNLYAKASVKLDSDNYGIYGLTAGAQQSVGLLRPFVEINTDFERQAKVTVTEGEDADGNPTEITTTKYNYIQKVGYDAGLTVYVNDYIQPFVEVNNFASEHNTYITGGAHFKLMDKVGCNLSVQYGPDSQWRQANVDLTYTF